MRRKIKRKGFGIGKKSFLLAGFLLLLVFFVFLILRSNFLSIKSINVNLDKIPCTDSENVKISSNLLDQNILFVNSLGVKSNLKNKFLCIKDVSILKQLPASVTLHVVGREAIAKLFKIEDTEASLSAFLENIATPSAKGSEIYLVDSEGVVFSKEYEVFNIPTIFFDQDISLGWQLSDDQKNSLKILEKIKSLGIEVKNMEIRNGFLIIFSQQKIIFRLNKIETQIASLQLILNKAKIDQESLEFIDLRFDKPVVKFAPKKN